MTEHEWLAEQFEEQRPHLNAVAYRILGSQAEADDAVQESWFRLTRSDVDSVDNLGGWLTTVVARVCLDMLRSRKSRREEPSGDEVPEIAASPADATDPEHQALLADSLGTALLAVLDTLGPAERIAFVLHDLFGVPFEEIAPIVERTPAATRQLASRARRRVRGTDQVRPDSPTRQREVVDAFFAAAHAGDFGRLVGVLAPDVVLHSDLGALRGGVVTYEGAETIARNALMFAHPDRIVHPVLVNGQAGVVITLHDELFSVMAFTVADGRIVGVDTWTDPEVLALVPRPK
jgi:RNA polymerase sigma factor (sigma-70 family)